VSSPLWPPSSSLPTSPHPYVDLSCYRASLWAPPATGARRQPEHAAVESSPPHRCAISSVSTPPPHHARSLPGDLFVPAGWTSSSASHRRATGERMLSTVTTAWARATAPLAWADLNALAVELGQRCQAVGQNPAQHCGRIFIFSIFSYNSRNLNKLQKCVETPITLGKL
jgi:hypothetical protein